jgi:hypothetical protein
MILAQWAISSPDGAIAGRGLNGGTSRTVPLIKPGTMYTAAADADRSAALEELQVQPRQAPPGDGGYFQPDELERRRGGDVNATNRRRQSTRPIRDQHGVVEAVEYSSGPISISRPVQ